MAEDRYRTCESFNPTKELGCHPLIIELYRVRIQPLKVFGRFMI